MNSLMNAIVKELSNGELASAIANELGDKKLKTKINKAIKSYFSDSKDETKGKATKKTEKGKAKKTEKGKAEKKERDLTDLPFEKWTVAELKEECKKKKLPTTGKKADLVERLEGDSDASGSEDSDVEEKKPAKGKAKGKGKGKAKKEESSDESSDEDEKVEEVDYNKMKVAELRNLCKEKGLDNKGNKKDLIERLETQEAASDDEDSDAPEEEEKDASEVSETDEESE